MQGQAYINQTNTAISAARYTTVVRKCLGSAGGLLPFLGALLVEALLFHRRVLFSADGILPWDFRGVHLPLATLAAGALRRGEFPLWDPFTYCGNPLVANIQAALFYPPMLAAAALGAVLGPALLPRILAWLVVAQVWGAGVCTLLLLRRLGARPAAAWTGATVYQLGCFFASQAQHIGAVQGAAWIPLAWLCVVELSDRMRRGWLALLAVSLAMTVLAGLPQVAVAAFGSVLALALLLPAVGLARRSLPLRALAAWGWALLLAAVQIAPTTELTRNSIAKFRAEWLKSGGGIKPGALLSLVAPNYWNVFDLSKFHGPSDPTFLYLYSSLLGLALALAAACWKPVPRARAFALLTAGACLWMLGDSTPLGRALFEALPVSIRIGIHPEFTLPVFSLGLAVLAGLGAERFLRRDALALAAGAVIAVELIAVGSSRPFNTASLAAEPGMSADSIEGSRELSRQLHSLAGAATPPFRYDTADAPFSWSGSGPLTGLPTANGCDPMAPERVIQVRLAFSPGARWGACYQVVNANSPVIGLANVRYLIALAPVTAEQFRPVAQIAGYRIYENQRVLPRYFLVHRARPAAGLAESSASLRSGGIDFAGEAILEGPGPMPGLGSPSARGSVEVVAFAPARVVLRAHAETPALLVATDTWYPGWHATVDGSPAPLRIADAAFRGIVVPAGDHTVEMRFAPGILLWSGAISLVALAAVAFAGIRRVKSL